MPIATSVINSKIHANKSRIAPAKLMIMNGTNLPPITIPGVHHLAL